jgi:hypothetical protein
VEQRRDPVLLEPKVVQVVDEPPRRAVELAVRKLLGSALLEVDDANRERIPVAPLGVFADGLVAEVEPPVPFALEGVPRVAPLEPVVHFFVSFHVNVPRVSQGYA